MAKPGAKPRWPRPLGPARSLWSGGSGIRTHGSLRLAAFQELCIRPLCHPSRGAAEAAGAAGLPLGCVLAHPTAGLLVEYDLAEPNGLGCHLNALIIGDELERLLEGHQRRRGEAFEVVRRG